MKYNEQTEEDNRDSGILSNPLSFTRNGAYGYGNANTISRGWNGYYWILLSYSPFGSSYLYFHSTLLKPQDGNYRGNGFAVHCVSNTEWSGGLAPDSICPKGWQLPTYSGDKSFTTLINTSYSMKRSWEAPEATSKDSGVLSNPLSYIHSGSIYWGNGEFNARGGNGYYWSLVSASTNLSFYLNFANTALNPEAYYNHGHGFAVRCVPNPSPLSLILAIL